jgi:hypothetical protein
VCYNGKGLWVMMDKIKDVMGYRVYNCMYFRG